MALEIALVTIFALAVVILLARGATPGALIVAASCLAAVGVGAYSWSPSADKGLASALPSPRADKDYVTSDSCSACHPGAYHAWKDSFHRTMTQVATPETVLADFEDRTLSSRGHTVRLERRGDGFWADLPDPLWFQDFSPDKAESPPRIQARIVMTTGSHHMQNYWLRRPSEGAVHADSYDNGALVELPFVWLIDAARWVPVQDSFLTPHSQAPDPSVVWNSACHPCHSVDTSPGYDAQQARFETVSVELGIACEACHGPAKAHVEQHRRPWSRYLAHLSDDPSRDTLIENPKRLARDRSVEACGQCHSFSRVVDIPKWQKSGIDYQPGQPLDTAKAVLRYSESPQDPHLLAVLEREPNALVGRFWPDGTIRVAGREMNGVVESACYERGELTCLSCHSMHDYESADDQLVAGGRGNGPCLSCHPTFAANVSSHTRHAPTSTGSLCMNCHMPHTTYGLFKAIRSHRIDSPSVATSVETGRPNACNLCHLDKSLAWTDQGLRSGWQVAPATIPLENAEIAASVEWALSGDAAQRAIVAWHFGWGPAREASGEDWLGLYLGQLLSDPYAAVRRVAFLSLVNLPGFADFEYDYVAEPNTLALKSQEAWARWGQQSARGAPVDNARLLLRPNREIDRATYTRLLRERDNTPLRIIE